MHSPPLPRVLLVDDEHDIRDAIANVLAVEGYEVTHAIHGRDALDQLEAGLAPAVVLLDLMMPVMDGETFLHTVRRHAEWRRFPVVLLSAVEPSPEAARAASAVLQKPVTLGALLAALRVFAPVA